MCCSAVCPKLANLNETSGVITSPFYPRNYPANQTCSWQITASKGNHVVLIIEYMDIQQCGMSCTCDHLEIQNGSSFDGLDQINGGRRCHYFDYNYYSNYDYYNYKYYYYYHSYNCYRPYYRYLYYYYYGYYYYCHWPLIFLSYRESLKVLFLSDGSSIKANSGFKATYLQVNRSAITTGKSEQGFYILVA